MNESFVADLQKCFYSQDSYINSKAYKKQLEQNPAQYVPIVCAAISETLTEGSPSQKLYALRFAKEIMDTKNEAFAEAYQQQGFSKMITIASFRKDDASENRGKFLFSDNPPKELASLGNSLMRLCLDCIKVWAYWFPKFNDTPSQYKAAYEKLLDWKVNFPKKFSYFKESDIADYVQHDNILSTLDRVQKELDLIGNILIGQGNDDEIAKLDQFIANLASLNNLIEQDLIKIIEDETKQQLVNQLTSHQETIDKLLQDYQLYKQSQLTIDDLKEKYCNKVNRTPKEAPPPAPAQGVSQTVILEQEKNKLPQSSKQPGLALDGPGANGVQVVPNTESEIRSKMQRKSLKIEIPHDENQQAKEEVEGALQVANYPVNKELGAQSLQDYGGVIIGAQKKVDKDPVANKETFQSSKQMQQQQEEKANQKRPELSQSDGKRPVTLSQLRGFQETRQPKAQEVTAFRYGSAYASLQSTPKREFRTPKQNQENKQYGLIHEDVKAEFRLKDPCTQMTKTQIGPSVANNYVKALQCDLQKAENTTISHEGSPAVAHKSGMPYGKQERYAKTPAESQANQFSDSQRKSLTGSQFRLNNVRSQRNSSLRQQKGYSPKEGLLEKSDCDIREHLLQEENLQLKKDLADFRLKYQEKIQQHSQEMQNLIAEKSSLHDKLMVLQLIKQDNSMIYSQTDENQSLRFEIEQLKLELERKNRQLGDLQAAYKNLETENAFQKMQVVQLSNQVVVQQAKIEEEFEQKQRSESAGRYSNTASQFRSPIQGRKSRAMFLLTDSQKYLIYPFDTAVEYYRERLKGKVKGAVVSRDWNYLNLDETNKFYLSQTILTLKSLLFRNQLLEVGCQIQKINENQLMVSLFYMNSNKLQSFKLDCSFNLALQIKAMQRNFTYQIHPDSSESQVLHVQLMSYPVDLSTLTLTIETAKQTSQTIYMPVTSYAFFQYWRTSAIDFRRCWKQCQQGLVRTEAFGYNQLLLPDLDSLTKYIPALIELNVEKRKDFLSGIGEVKFGGVFNYKCSRYLMRFIMRPDCKMIIQLGFLSGRSNKSDHLLNTLLFIFN